LSGQLERLTRLDALRGKGVPRGAPLRRGAAGGGCQNWPLSRSHAMRGNGALDALRQRSQRGDASRAMPDPHPIAPETLPGIRDAERPPLRSHAERRSEEGIKEAVSWEQISKSNLLHPCEREDGRDEIEDTTTPGPVRPHPVCIAGHTRLLWRDTPLVPTLKPPRRVRSAWERVTPFAAPPRPPYDQPSANPPDNGWVR